MIRDRRQRGGGRLCSVILPLCGFAAAALGDPPIEPLPAAFFSFDVDSPAVLDGFVDGDGILEVDFPHPATAFSGEAFGLGRIADELDGLSVGNPSLPSDAQFVLLFSVGEETVGTAVPDPELMELGVPYNALDQASRGHAAGDQFMSTTLFVRTGAPSADTSNNVLVRNNFDEGGVDFAAYPPTSAGDMAVGEPQDHVDAAVTVSGFETVYYTVNAMSASLYFLPGSDTPSGAYVFSFSFDEDPPTLFASFVDLGLEQDDDVDALLVFDTDSDRVFDDSDQVLFSLIPDSPSLSTIPGASPTGAAADVFVVTPTQSPVVFAAAADLGLGHVQDNIRALDYFACDDAEACAAAHGIRSTAGIPTVSDWGIVAMTLLVLVAGTIIIPRQRYAQARQVS